MDERPAKRHKFKRGKDDYAPGNVTKIVVRNFMTFDYGKCKPSPRLNLVIGPNGSGKSSVVCALGLGLSGEPQLLGRASSIGSYVKRGEENGYIEIHLRGDTEDEKINITRKVDIHNKSEWLLNGKAVPRKDIVEVIQRFNIQVNNLTQFLPQDRVCEFAKLTPVQLLQETEKAVGDPQLPIKHRALIDKSKELSKLQKAVETNESTLNQLKARKAEQEKDVERVRQREEYLAKAECMKKKLPWLKYDMKKVEYLKAKEVEKEAKTKLDEAARILNDQKEPIERQKQERAKLDSKCKKIRSTLNENAKKHMELSEKHNRLGVQVNGKYNEMEELKRQEDSRQHKVSSAKEELAAAETELKNLPPFEPPKDLFEKLRSQILDLELAAKQKKTQRADIEKNLAQKRCVLRQQIDRLKDMENKNNKLLHVLKTSGAERIFEAYRWLQEHRQEFHKDVYGPVLLEVNISNQLHADYLEGHVPNYIWKSFITQDSRDRDFLVKNLKHFDVPVLNYVGDERHQDEPFNITEEMRLLGIYSRLDQVFGAPYAVKKAMVGQFGLDHSYIGSNETDQKANEVAKLGILDFWTPENHYRWSVSRYGGHQSASVDQVHRSRLLLCSSDSREIESLKSKKVELEETISSLEETVKLIQMELKQLEDEAAKFHKEREELLNTVQQEKKKRRDLENRVNQRRRKLEALEEEVDIDSVLAKLLDQVQTYNMQRFHLAIEIKNLLLGSVAHRRLFSETYMTFIEVDAKIRDLEVSLKQHEKLAMQASMHLENCKKEVENSRAQLSTAKRHAESVAMITPELKREFLEMPTTIEELDAAIKDNISQANAILFLNQNIVEEYEHLQNQIETLAVKLERDRREQAKCLAELHELKDDWLPKLRNIVTEINETFSRNFKEMAVAGEVSLDEREMDFDQYGILIKVKFREAGQLQVLSAQHQSGGERSVSTILYLVALQDLTNCPFRVVDEINQGMDPINERKMFQQLVKAASRPNTSQCFLLTPKLLPDLEYTEDCTILNIMTGPYIKQVSKVWEAGESWAAVTGLLGESRC